MLSEKLPEEATTFATQCGAHVLYRRTKTRQWTFYHIFEFTSIAKAAQLAFVKEFSDECTETDNIGEFFDGDPEEDKLAKRIYMEEKGTVLIIPKTQDEVDRFVLLPLEGSVPVTYRTMHTALQNRGVILGLKTEGVTVGMGLGWEIC